MPDLVLSGINKGFNLGDDLRYSGTVSGAQDKTRRPKDSVVLPRPIHDNRKSMIELDGVTKRFDDRSGVVALDNVSLTVPRGQLVSLIGPSGSGKSTLLNLIGGLDRPTSGEIRDDGESIGRLSDDARTRARRDKIGFIFQFFNLLPSLTCLENVALPLHLRGWPRKQVTERARELLGLVQLSDRLHHRPDEISGGQRQRVAIARALSVNPPILLADEPTGNLDTRTGADILALVRDLHTRFGATILIVTHDQTVAQSCERIVTLRDGRIVEDVTR
jgi:putative ABC transport system ATP-binding protein